LLCNRCIQSSAILEQSLVLITFSTPNEVRNCCPDITWQDVDLLQFDATTNKVSVSYLIFVAGEHMF
jgi:hypothetical protein